MKSQKILKRAVSLMLVFVLMVGIIPNFGTKAEAYSSVYNRGAIVYTYNYDGYTTVYCNSIGAAYQRGSTVGSIYNWCDDLRLLKIDEYYHTAYVRYPVRNGYKYGWITLSQILPNATFYPSNFIAKNWVRSAKRCGSSFYEGYCIDRGDSVYLLANYNGWYAVLYPISGGYRIGWLTWDQYKAVRGW